jgi:hypothetical protein
MAGKETVTYRFMYDHGDGKGPQMLDREWISENLSRPDTFHAERMWPANTAPKIWVEKKVGEDWKRWE